MARIITIKTNYYECKFTSDSEIQWIKFPDFLRGNVEFDLSPQITISSIHYPVVILGSRTRYTLLVPGNFPEWDSMLVKFPKAILPTKEFIRNFKERLDCEILSRLGKL